MLHLGQRRQPSRPIFVDRLVLESLLADGRRPLGYRLRRESGSDSKASVSNGVGSGDDMRNVPPSASTLRMSAPIEMTMKPELAATVPQPA
jgi:hypothetical protein